MGRFNIREFIARRGFMVVLLCPAIFLCLTNGDFRNPQNLSNVLAQSSIVGIVAIGMTIVMIAGGFDLSIGATAALAGLVAVIVFGHGEPIFMALGIVAALASGIAIGLINGLLVSRVEINPLIATLAMSSIVRGVVLIASEGTIFRTTGDAAAITVIALGRWRLFPIAGLFFIGAIMLGWLILRKMTVGHHIYAIGGSESASTLAGVPVKRTIIFTYAVMGAFAAISGVLLMARTGSALTSAGLGLELEAITAAVIGGTRLGGGAGSISGTVLGVLLLGVIRNGLNLNGVSPFWQPFVVGCILLLTVTISRGTRGRGRILSRFV